MKLVFGTGWYRHIRVESHTSAGLSIEASPARSGISDSGGSIQERQPWRWGYLGGAEINTKRSLIFTRNGRQHVY